MIKESIAKLIDRIDLSAEETEGAFTEIMEGNASPSQIGAFLTALRMKGETIDEITNAARVMRAKSIKIDVRENSNELVIDTCGTGGSLIPTFNISTAVAFVVAGCNIKVAKHGNRSASGRCGSADVLEALGVNINLPPEKITQVIKEIGIGFLFAPLYHPAMKFAAPVRKELGIRTIFNILGPISNPADASVQLVGVSKPELTEIISGVLKNLGTKSALVVHGLDGKDEISITGETKLTELKDGKIRTFLTTPEEHGFKRQTIESLKCRGVKENAEALLKTLNGEKGPYRDVVLLNSAYALYISGRRDMPSALKEAEDSIDSGKALDKLNRLIETTKKLS